MDTKKESILLLFTRNTPHIQRQVIPQSKRMGNDFPIKWAHKQVGVAILISNKLDFKLKSIKKDEEGHFILITRKFHQDEVSILNTYSANKKEHTFAKETLLKHKRHIKTHAPTVKDFNNPLSPLDRTTRKKIKKETKNIREVMMQLG